MRDDGQAVVDVIIPVYKPDETFGRLLEMLKRQTHPVHKIIVINTEEEFWPGGAYDGCPGLEVHHIRKSEFDHGGTRRQGAGYSRADIMVFMTDDAVPADNRLIEELAGGLREKPAGSRRPAVCYARQLAAKGCGELEEFSRRFNYPDTGMVKSMDDLERLGIKTYFASNVCCAYDREIYGKLGGFVDRAIFNEDMLFAAKAVQAGYSVVYAAGAKVVHSHNYTCMQQFHRNFDLGVSQAAHPEVFARVKPEGEGIRLVKKNAAWLVKRRKPWLLPKLALVSGFKYLGYFLGKRYRSLPGRLVVWCSMNREYWKKGG